MRSRLSQFTFGGLGVVTVLCSSASQVFAGGKVAPEIDASAVSAGLGLLTAGVLI